MRTPFRRGDEHLCICLESPIVFTTVFGYKAVVVRLPKVVIFWSKYYEGDF